jgi:hypothetical protein
MNIPEIMQKLDPIQTAIDKGGCEKPDGDFCLHNEREDEGHGWAAMNPSRMCMGCAAYWHIASAVNLLRDMLRREQIMEASQH